MNLGDWVQTNWIRRAAGASSPTLSAPTLSRPAEQPAAVSRPCWQVGLLGPLTPPPGPGKGAWVPKNAMMMDGLREVPGLAQEHTGCSCLCEAHFWAVSSKPAPPPFPPSLPATSPTVTRSLLPDPRPRADLPPNLGPQLDWAGTGHLGDNCPGAETQALQRGDEICELRGRHHKSGTSMLSHPLFYLILRMCQGVRTLCPYYRCDYWASFIQWSHSPPVLSPESAPGPMWGAGEWLAASARMA